MDILDILNIPYFKQGDKIHIKEKNKGKFTEYCDGEVTQNCIDKAKNSGNPTLKKRAIFAENARSWKHVKGGQLIPKHQTGKSIEQKAKEAAAAKEKYAKYNIATMTWDENGYLPNINLPEVSITADSPETETNKRVLLNHGYTQKDLENPNIRRNLNVLANNILLREKKGKEYLENVGKVGLGLAGILTGGSGVGLAGALGREGIKQGAKTLRRKALRFGVDTGVGAATDYASNKAIQKISNGEYEGFGDLMNRGVFNGSKDDVWKSIVWDMVNPLGIATGIGTDFFLNSSNLGKALQINNILRNDDRVQFMSNGDYTNPTHINALRREQTNVDNNVNLQIENDEELQNQVKSFFIPRMKFNANNARYSDIMLKNGFVPIKKYDTNKFNNDLGFISNLGGWYNYDKRHIIDLNLNRYNKVHEYSHAFDHNVFNDFNYAISPLVKSHMRNYHNDVNNFMTGRYTYNLEDNMFDIREFDADTRALRLKLFDDLHIDPAKLNVEEQNKIISELNDDWLSNNLQRVSGYGSRLFDQIKTPEDFKKIKQIIIRGMQTLPAASIPIMLNKNE